MNNEKNVTWIHVNSHVGIRPQVYVDALAKSATEAAQEEIMNVNISKPLNMLLTNEPWNPENVNLERYYSKEVEEIFDRTSHHTPTTIIRKEREKLWTQVVVNLGNGNGWTPRLRDQLNKMRTNRMEHSRR